MPTRRSAIAREPTLSLLQLQGIQTVAAGPVSLLLAPGECIGITGPSGAGKSLLLRAIADLDVHRGDAFLDGVSRERFSASAWRRRVGLLPPQSHWWHARVADHRLPRNGRWLADLGLDPALAAAPLDRLSSGERQRFALLRLLANAPRVLLLDEPSANLDSDNIGRLERLLLRYCSDTGAGMLWVTHDAAQVARVATRHFRLEQGHLSARPLGSS